MGQDAVVLPGAPGLISPEDIVEQLGLEPHPEGGWFRETHRSEPPTGADRSAGTAIYFLVTRESPSRLHRVDADEVFHHYAGATVEQLVVEDGGTATVRHLGSDLDLGQRPQSVVPAGAWQGCHVLDAPGWALLGCTVSPGFEFAGFTLATAADVQRLTQAAPAHADLVARLA